MTVTAKSLPGCQPRESKTHTKKSARKIGLRIVKVAVANPATSPYRIIPTSFAALGRGVDILALVFGPNLI